MNQQQNPSDKLRHENDSQLAHRLAEEEGISEDLAETLVNNWQRIVGALAVVVLFAWLFREYQAAEDAKRGKASALFARAQASFTELYDQQASSKDEPAKKKTDEELEKSRTILQENLEALKKDGEDTAYRELGILYQAAYALHESKPKDALDLLNSFQVNRFLTAGPQGKQSATKSFVPEYAALLTAKARLASGESAGDVRPLLEGLAKNGTLLNVEAVGIVLHLASTTEEKEAAIKLANDVKASHSEYIDLINRELNAAGVSTKTIS